MEQHLSRASHNLRFFEVCERASPSCYFDWKITIAFYSTLHLLRAFCIKRGVYPGNTHASLASFLSQRRCNGKTATPFPQHVWDWYESLQRYSELARYSGFRDQDMENEVQRLNLEHCRNLYVKLAKYFKKNGVPCNAHISRA